MDKSADHAQPQSDAPDTIEGILLARADYEEAKIWEIKEAVDRGDQKRVFELAKELIYGGPGSRPRLSLEPKLHSRRPKRGANRSSKGCAGTSFRTKLGEALQTLQEL